jgi:hypothetical protein
MECLSLPGFWFFSQFVGAKNTSTFGAEGSATPSAADFLPVYDLIELVAAYDFLATDRGGDLASHR